MRQGIGDRTFFFIFEKAPILAAIKRGLFL